MTDDTAFHTRADATLLTVMDALDPHDAVGALEADLMDGVLTIECPGGQQIVVSKHAASGQVWLSSPISGGLHFAAQPEGEGWQLPDGRTLTAVLAEELQSLAGVACDFGK